MCMSVAINSWDPLGADFDFLFCEQLIQLSMSSKTLFLFEGGGSSRENDPFFRDIELYR